MNITDFHVSLNAVERRSDSHDYIGYSVTYQDKMYIIYYYKKEIKEVYFFDKEHSGKYFMSCRPDMRTISHYYYLNQYTIARYENGYLNRLYYQQGQAMYYEDHGKKIWYSHKFPTEPIDTVKVLTDLIHFLEDFHSQGLDKEFGKPKP